MAEEIQGVSGKSGSGDPVPLVWQPWQPPFIPPNPVTEAAPDEGIAAPRARVATDRNGSSPLGQQLWSQTRAKAIDVNALQVPELGPDGKAIVDRLSPLDLIREAGVVAAIAQVATAYTQPIFAPDQVASSLGAFAQNLQAASATLDKIPGATEALGVFGGIGGIVAGVQGFKATIESVRQDGTNLSNGLGAAASAAQLVGGVAAALAPFCPPVGLAGAALIAAGTALKLGKLAYDNRDDLKRAAATGAEAFGSAADQALRIVSNNGARIGDAATRIISNNGSAAVRDVPQGAWQWVTG